MQEHATWFKSLFKEFCYVQPHSHPDSPSQRRIFCKHGARKRAEQVTFPLRGEDTQVYGARSGLAQVTLPPHSSGRKCTFSDSCFYYKVLFLLSHTAAGTSVSSASHGSSVASTSEALLMRAFIEELVAFHGYKG